MRSGTLVVCVQNLDFSGANQVVLNIVSGKVHESNIVVLSPKIGAFAARFVDSGAAVRVGELDDLLYEIRDVFCIICNTIMTAPIVVEMSTRLVPCLWILHEWWDDNDIVENLRIRNYKDFTIDTVKQALAKATMVVFVCESQRQLYQPTAPSSVIFVGVPDPIPRHITGETQAMLPGAQSLSDLASLAVEKESDTFTVLCLGIICPRKNQIWTIELFKEFAKNKPNARLKVVGARYTRVYEMEYLEQVKKVIDGDPRITVHDVTNDVDPLYKEADAVMLTSLNEVTPMVISEALSWSIPVLSTNIAGIKEMYVDGKEGYLFAPGESEKALKGLEQLYRNKPLRDQMGVNARIRFEKTFDLDLMVDKYRQLMFEVAPPVVLFDMDGCLVDWDMGFVQAWANRCPLDRTLSYYMEDCIEDVSLRCDALTCFNSQGFFENLEPMPGAIQAVKEMEAEGIELYICTSPIKSSKYCAQEKLNWIVKYLGEEWLDKTVLCQDKTQVVGDLLIDDKPMDYLYPTGKHLRANWRQILFDAPYNQQPHITTPRLVNWADWPSVVLPLLGKKPVSPAAFSSSSSGIRSRSGSYQGNVFQLPQLDNLPQDTTSNRPIGMVKLKRDTSAGADGKPNRQALKSLTRMTAQDIQKGIDMLQSSSEPLSPEDIATILSASLSLINDDIDLISDASSETSGTEMGPEEVADRIKTLSDAAAKRQKDHQMEVDASQREAALQGDEAESEGLQLFRKAYKRWMKAHPSTPTRGGSKSSDK